VFCIRDVNNISSIMMFLAGARQSRASQLLMLAWAAQRMGSWEGTQLGQLTQRAIPHHMMSWLVHKLGGTGWRGSDHCSGIGWCDSSGGEQMHLCITCFVSLLLVVSSSAFLLNCLYLSPRVFTFSHPLPHPMGRWELSEQLSGA